MSLIAAYLMLQIRNLGRRAYALAVKHGTDLRNP